MSVPEVYRYFGRSVGAAIGRQAVEAPGSANPMRRDILKTATIYFWRAVGLSTGSEEQHGMALQRT